MRDKFIEIADHAHRIRPGIDWISEDGKATWIEADSKFERVPVGSLKTGTVVACIPFYHPFCVKGLKMSSDSEKFTKEYYTGEERVWLIERTSPTTAIHFSKNGSIQEQKWTETHTECAYRAWTKLSEADAINLRASFMNSDYVDNYILPPMGVIESKNANQPEQIPMAGGKAASSKGPAFHLIPTVALIEIANRFEKGIERKKDKAWNATSNNQECLLDKDFTIERLSHVIHHAMKLRDQLVSGVESGDESMVDNASAVAWGGVFAICAVSAMDGRTPKIT